MTAAWMHSTGLWFALAGMLAAGALALLGWALMGDRARGRRRCRRCWYDMAGVSPRQTGGGSLWTCPECGAAITSERAMLRTRRRKGAACVAALLLVGSWVVAEQPEVRRRGWMWLSPTGVLLEGLPLAGYDSAVGREISRRLGRMAWPGGGMQTTVSDSQLATVFERCAAGNVLARPVVQRWQGSYGQLLRRDLLQIWNQRAIPESPTGDAAEQRSDAQNRMVAAVAKIRRLHGTPIVRSRAKWPRGMPLHVGVEVEQWWHPSSDFITHLEWSSNGSSEKGESWFVRSTDLRVPLEGHVRLNFRVAWVEGANAARDHLNSHELSVNTFTIEYDTVNGIDDVLTPTESPTIDSLMSLTLAARRSLQMDWPSISAFQGKQSSNLAFGLRVEYVLDGHVLGATHARFSKDIVGYTEGDIKTCEDHTWQQLQELLQHPSLVVRVSIDPLWALSNLDATGYWKGENVPIRLAP